MGKLRHAILPAKGTVEHHMQRSRRQPLLTTDDMRDLHQMVINDIGKVIGGQLVGTLIQHLIVNDITLHTHLTTDEVVDQNLLSRLYLEANHILLAISNPLLHLLFRQGQRVTHLLTGMAVVLEILHFRTFRLQFRRSIEGNICLTSVQQLLDIFLVNVTTLTLTIWSFVSSEGHSLIKLDTQPFE